MRPATLAAAALSLCLPFAAFGDDGGLAPHARSLQAHVARGQQAQAAADPAGRTAPAAAPAVTWNPQVTDQWEWQLGATTIDTKYNVLVYDIDMTDALPANIIATLHGQGRVVVCYISVGTAENWRSDYGQFKPADLGNNVDGWPGEKWVDTRSTNVRNIMAARFATAKSRGCDGVEPDNVDAYENNPGFPLTAATQLDYNRFVATSVHGQGLKVGLKNDVDQLSTLAPSFDFAINEQCHQYSECGGYTVFTNAGKPVFNAEYAKKYKSGSAQQSMCASARAANLRTLVLSINLDDSYHYSCDTGN
jgi:endo-alpha-1,4-polygalactosaminidase (GH114 family)